MPQSISKPIRARLIEKLDVEKEDDLIKEMNRERFFQMSPKEQKKTLREFEIKMKTAAEVLDFELAAKFRDKIREFRRYQG